MPDFDSMLDTDSIERFGDLYRIKPDIAARARAALQRTDLSIYHVRDHTPGGALLTDGNIAQAIRNAYAASQGLHLGGIVQLPRGDWHMGSSGGLDLPGTGDFNAGTVIKGAANGCTTLVYPAPWTGEMIHLRGCTEGHPEALVPPFPWRQGGIVDVNFFVDAPGYGDLTDPNTGRGIVIDACTNTRFENVVVQNLSHGSSWYCRDFAGGSNNSQYCTFINCAGRGGWIDWDLENLSASQFVNVDARYSNHLNMRIDACSGLQFYGGALQSTGRLGSVEFGPLGGSQVLFDGQYHEGGGPDNGPLADPRYSTGTFFKFNDCTTSQEIAIKRFICRSGWGCFAEVGEATSLILESISGIGNCLHSIKARASGYYPAPSITMIDCGSPTRDPARFDLDVYSKRKFFCHSAGWTGSVAYRDLSVGAHVAAESVSTGAFEEGAEPLPVAIGAAVFNDTTKRPRVHNGTAWRDVAYADDAPGLVALLKPYCAAILDPRVYKRRSVISGELDALTDLAHGGIATAPSSGRRPVWLAQDPAFGGAPSWECSNALDKCLTLTLATPIPSGSRPGVMIIGRATGTYPEGVHRRVFAADVGGFYLLGQDGDGGGTWSFSHADTNQNNQSGFGDGLPHMFLANDDFDGTGYFWRGTVDTTDGGRLVNSDLGVSGSAISALSIGHLNPAVGAGTNSADFVFAWVAFFHTSLPPQVKAKAIALADAEFRLGL